MSKATISEKQSTDDYYLPGVSISTEPGPVEQFLTRLFRRRGRF